MISEQKIKELQRLWEQLFGESLSDNEAQEQANKLLQMVKLAYKPMKKVELEKLEQRKSSIFQK